MGLNTNSHVDEQIGLRFKLELLKSIIGLEVQFLSTNWPMSHLTLPSSPPIRNQFLYIYITSFVDIL